MVLQHFFKCFLFLTTLLLLVRATGQTGGGAGQHGGRAAAGRVQAARRLRAALGADAPLPVPLLPQPAGSAHHPADGLAHRDRPQKVRRVPTFAENLVQSHLPFAIFQARKSRRIL